MYKKRYLPAAFLLILILIAFSFNNDAYCSSKSSEPLSWPEVRTEHKPGVYWWWPGSGVDEPNLTWNLENLHGAGIGGVTVVPIYGVKGEEERFIEYLSDDWMHMLEYTAGEAKRLGMNVDMTTGTGWPFGGPFVPDDEAVKVYEFKKYKLKGGGRIEEKISEGRLQAIMAYEDTGLVIDLIDKVDANGKLDWTSETGAWTPGERTIYTVSSVNSGMQVKRAAPGGEGHVVDPYSVKAISNYLKNFDRAFAKYEGPLPRAQYHDSFEYRANWTDNFFDEFKVRRGYELKKHLPALLGEGNSDKAERVKADCSETIAELVYEYIKYWVEWSHGKGFKTRNQAHGSPGNLLDLYALADIPECETFGATKFKIPGFRRKLENVRPQDSSPTIIKFASSAAHVAGKRLVCSESCTWLREHFKVSLSHCKPEIDRLFSLGVNHLFYHGIPYSPKDADWPGWLFYASSHFGPTNSFWRDFGALNDYVARCQSILQSGAPCNDILLYWPLYDYWHTKETLVPRLSIHHTKEWRYKIEFFSTAEKMLNAGYAFDFISDRQVGELKVSRGLLQTGGVDYKIVLVPPCRRMPLRTMKRLISLAKAGATVVFEKRLPEDVPGFGNLENRRTDFEKVISKLRFGKVASSGIKRAKVGKGSVLVGEDLISVLTKAGAGREVIVDKGVSFIRRSHNEGHHYFLANLGDKNVDGWVPFAVKANSVVIMNTLTGASGVGAVRRKQKKSTEVYLQLSPGESVILRTFTKKRAAGAKWRYLESAVKRVEIKGRWQVAFIDGGPELPDSYETEELGSWTAQPDVKAKQFAGTARYSITFDKPVGEADEYILELGEVRDSAKVYVNGEYAGSVFSIPFKVKVGRFLKDGKNKLEVEVTNLAANRIADMDRRGVKWKKFYNINYASLKYKAFDASGWELEDSGLLGPVRLAGATLKRP